MGSALIRGVASGEDRAGAKIRFFDSDSEKRRDLCGKPGIECAPNSSELAEWADIIVLAVKPGDVKGVLGEIREKLVPSKMILSVAAGVDTRTIEKTAAVNIPVVRAMPNTPAVVGLGAIALCAGRYADEEHLKRAETCLAPAGEVLRVEEEMMDTATAVSGSGPAYLFYLAEAMEEAGVKEGLSRKASRMLVNQTLYGASALLVKENTSPGELRRMVTSPGGTTEAAIKTLREGGFADLIKSAVKSARNKSSEIRELISTSE